MGDRHRPRRRRRRRRRGARGHPEAIVKAGKGHTARFLKEVLERRPIAKGKAVAREAAE
jgi:excinuclease ABC subunit A